jgi:hypothetical protein
VSTTEHDTAAALDSRYGRTPARAKRTRLFGLVAAGAFVVVFAAWVIWAGLIGPQTQLEVNDTGYVIVDDSLVQVRYELNVRPGTETSCAVQALNSTFAIVGWKIVDIPASETRVRSLGTDVRTTELGVTGLIYRCWLT